MSYRKNKRMNRSVRSGFTLLELLLVMAILVILASLSTVAVLNLQSSSQSKAAFAQIKLLKNAVTMYKLNGNSSPNDLKDLIIQPAGMPIAQWGGPYLDGDTIPLDPWQKAYQYKPNSGDKVFISSAGKDGQFGTNDDIPGTGG